MMRQAHLSSGCRLGRYYNKAPWPNVPADFLPRLSTAQMATQHSNVRAAGSVGQAQSGNSVPFDDLHYLVNTFDSAEPEATMKKAYASLMDKWKNGMTAEHGLSNEQRSALCGKSFEEALVKHSHDEVIKVGTTLFEAIEPQKSKSSEETIQMVNAGLEMIRSQLKGKTSQDLPSSGTELSASRSSQVQIAWAAPIGKSFSAVLPDPWSRYAMATGFSALQASQDESATREERQVLVRGGESSWLLSEDEEPVSVEEITREARESAGIHLRQRASQLRESLSQQPSN